MLIEGLREPRLDLAAFQEPIKTDSYDQVLDLVGPGFHLVHHDAGLVGDADHHGASIASRWPFGEVCEVDSNVTPPTADFACATLRAEVLAPDPLGPLLFVNHLPSWQPNFGYERELQAVAAARFVEEFVGWCSVHVVPGDDFDADPHAASVRFWSGRQSLGGTSVCYRNAWGGANPGIGATLSRPTIPQSPIPTGRSEGSTTSSYGVVIMGDPPSRSPPARIFDEPIDGVWASDHFGVVADLAVHAPERSAQEKDPDRLTRPLQGFFSQ